MVGKCRELCEGIAEAFDSGVMENPLKQQGNSPEGRGGGEDFRQRGQEEPRTGGRNTFVCSRNHR